MKTLTGAICLITLEHNLFFIFSTTLFKNRVRVLFIISVLTFSFSTFLLFLCFSISVILQFGVIRVTQSSQSFYSPVTSVISSGLCMYRLMDMSCMRGLPPYAFMD